MNVILELVSNLDNNKLNNLGEPSESDDRHNGKRLIDYEILQVLSEEYNRNYVSKVRSLNNNNIYSMKKIDLSQCPNVNQGNYIQNIMEKLKKLKNSHIIKYPTYFIENNNLYIIMEYMDNADIIGFIKAHQILNKSIPEDEIWNILLQCLSAMDYLHKQDVGKYGIKLNNIFLNIEQNAKIGVFREIISDNENFNPKEDIYMLGKFFYVMMNSQNIDSKVIKKPDFIANLDYEIVENEEYSKELRDIINSMSIKKESNETVESLYNTVKEQYVKKYAKNTSIEAVLRCLLSYKELNDIIFSKKSVFEKDKEKYYISYWYGLLVEYLMGFKEENDKKKKIPEEYIEEFRRAIASYYSKLDGNREINPLLLLTFLLVMIHKEMNEFGAELDKNKENNQSKNEKLTKYVISTSFNEEEDKHNKLQMWNKFITDFNSKKHSPISDLFFGFIKRKLLCQTCKSGFYSFYPYMFIIFDLSGRNDNDNFDLIENGFKEKHNNFQKIDKNGPNKMICDRCQLYQDYKEFNRYYMLKDNLIIYFNRGNNFTNKSKIEFTPEINLKDYIEPDIKSPYIFNLVGSVIRSIEDNNEKFFSYSKDPDNSIWHLPKGNHDYFNKDLKNYITNIENNENSQIIMLFYKAQKQI